MMLVLLTLICQGSSFSIWEQMPVKDKSPVGDITTNPPGLSGGFWGSLLGHSSQPGESDVKTSPESEVRSERLVQSRRRVLPSSLRSLHTFTTEYEDQDYDYDYSVEQGEVFSPEESRANQVTKTHQ